MIDVKASLKSIHSAVNTLALAVVLIVIGGIFILPMFRKKDSAEAKRELAALGKALAALHSETGSWPEGGAIAVAGALLGAEGGKALVEHERRDAQGRFIDPWETPFRFYFSQNAFAIQSAGPDGKFADGQNEEDDYWFSSR